MQVDGPWKRHYSSTQEVIDALDSSLLVRQGV